MCIPAQTKVSHIGVGTTQTNAQKCACLFVIPNRQCVPPCVHLYVVVDEITGKANSAEVDGVLDILMESRGDVDKLHDQETKA